MAAVKFINGKNKKIAGLIDAIDYVVDENKTEVFLFKDKELDVKNSSKDQIIQIDQEMLFVEKLLNNKKQNKGKQAINYITKDNKTNINLITGINCNPETAFEEMMITKKMFRKIEGRQFIHFVHSYHPYEEVTPEILHEISLKLVNQVKFKGFEILAATHIDKDHIHTHFVLNTVNAETGKKWQQSNKELEELKAYSNQLCHEYGLKYSFVEPKKEHSQSKSTGEYRAEKSERSWKYEAFKIIKECKNISTSKEEFIKHLNDLEYQVRWEETRKNITFTFPNGRKCNNDKFYPPDDFAKETLIKRFELNKQLQEREEGLKAKEEFESKKELILRTMKMIKEDPKLEKYKDCPMTYLEKLGKKDRSWKYELFLAVKECRKISISKEDFIKNMKDLGYQVCWKETRKNITFTLPSGRKCNNDKLHPPKNFTKEALLEKFEKNKEWQEKQKDFKARQSFEIKKDLMYRVVKLLEEDPKLEQYKGYPLTYLEGQALKEKMIEQAKGKGLDWEKER